MGGHDGQQPFVPTLCLGWEASFILPTFAIRKAHDSGRSPTLRPSRLPPLHRCVRALPTLSGVAFLLLFHRVGN